LLSGAPAENGAKGETKKMYLNNATLTGFLGGDAETRTTKNNTSFTVFSLATKNSWKNRETGEWISRTEWHRAVVFGRLTAFAATLRKDHVQIQGQLRTREYDKPADGKNKSAVKQRITEIRVTSILKLDRRWKQDSSQPEDQGAAA
jgi:single-strand DNA-binding protein